jgi:hypothetical protein
MLIEKNFFNLLYLGSKYKQPTRMPMPNPRHLVGILPKYHDNSSRRKTRDLIKTLLGHGARSARINQPRARIAINVFMPDGNKAVRLKMARQV